MRRHLAPLSIALVLTPAQALAKPLDGCWITPGRIQTPREEQELRETLEAQIKEAGGQLGAKGIPLLLDADLHENAPYLHAQTYLTWPALGERQPLGEAKIIPTRSIPGPLGSAYTENIPGVVSKVTKDATSLAAFEKFLSRLVTQEIQVTAPASELVLQRKNVPSPPEAFHFPSTNEPATLTLRCVPRGITAEIKVVWGDHKHTQKTFEMGEGPVSLSPDAPNPPPTASIPKSPDPIPKTPPTEPPHILAYQWLALTLLPILALVGWALVRFNKPEEVLYGELMGLLPAQFEEVLFRLKAPRQHLPPQSAPQAERAIALMQWLKQQRKHRELRQVLARVKAGGNHEHSTP